MRRALRVALFVAMLAGIVLALRESSSSAGTVLWPSAPAVGAAFLLTLALTGLTTVGWTVLLSGHARGTRGTLARGFVYGQLGKYVPGGVVQVAKLYESSRRAGLERSTIAVALPVYALCGVVAPGAVAAVALGVVGDELHPSARLALGLVGAFVVVACLHRRVLSRLFDALNVRWQRVPSSAALADQRTILRTFGCSSVGVLCLGAAYAALLDVDGVHEFVVCTLGFVVAFAIGFVALPFPSGMGVREAALTALLLEVATVANLLSAAIAVRIVQLLAELLAAAVASAGPLWLRLRGKLVP